jgi:tRNA threonylcarbamoyl adenosine modification protein YeaZ
LATPLVLSFDTSAAHCAAALLSGREVIDQSFEPMDRGQAERLMPLVEELLARNAIRWRDLTLIGVGTGPGNFTGVRISVAAARGLSLALGIPAVGVDGLEALSFRMEGPIRVALHGPRGTYYVRDYLDRTKTAEARLISGDDPEFWPARGGAVPVGDWPEPPPGRPDLRVARPEPGAFIAAIAHIALTKSALPQPRPAPLYLRPADAAPSRDAVPLLLP